jgi:DNA-binding GntR family transcriptional regulator
MCRRDADGAAKAMAAHISANYQAPDEDFSKSVGAFLKKYLHEAGD